MFKRLTHSSPGLFFYGPDAPFASPSAHFASAVHGQRGWEFPPRPTSPLAKETTGQVCLPSSCRCCCLCVFGSFLLFVVGRCRLSVLLMLMVMALRMSSSLVRVVSLSFVRVAFKSLARVVVLSLVGIFFLWRVWCRCCFCAVAGAAFWCCCCQSCKPVLGGDLPHTEHLAPCHTPSHHYPQQQPCYLQPGRSRGALPRPSPCYCPHPCRPPCYVPAHPQATLTRGRSWSRVPGRCVSPPPLPRPALHIPGCGEGSASLAEVPSPPSRTTQCTRRAPLGTRGTTQGSRGTT